jgi:hypothetical protein
VKYWENEMNTQDLRFAVVQQLLSMNYSAEATIKKAALIVAYIEGGAPKAKRGK